MFYPFRRFDEDKTYRLMISLIGANGNFAELLPGDKVRIELDCVHTLQIRWCRVFTCLIKRARPR